jgi:hypothetical protein
MFSFIGTNAQIITDNAQVPSGAIIYSLPSTTVSMKVTAEHESFVAGPYAKYAQKYLGIDARTESGDYYTIKDITMMPYVEADPSVNVAINLGNSKNASANFLNFCAQGLVISSDSYTGKANSWRFPSVANNSEFAGSGAVSNLTNMSTTLYKAVRTSDGLETVPVQQKQIVEKSVEKKAEETAAMIFKLRQKRMDIITGETDMNYTGEAMKSVLDEISRLEQEYLSLFMGKSLKDDQTVIYDVIPKASNPKQMYIAFRMSDNQGLLPASNVSGRPFMLEFIADDEAINTSDVATLQSSSKGKIAYRKPVTVNVRLLDGQKVIMQTRMPIYQFGKVLFFPMDIAMGR